jgi:hypothetical protein
VLSTNPLNVSFIRHLVGNNFISWQIVVAMVRDVQLTGQKDRFRWVAQQDGKFTVRSMYRVLAIPLAIPNGIPHNHIIWKLKLPLKVKVFIWYLIKGIALTKDNLAKRRWKGSLKCSFCNMDEFTQRLFFYCPYARLVWRVIQVSFNITPPLNIHHMFTGWMQGVEKKLRYKILVGSCTLCWALWLSQNDVVFDKV